MSAASISDVGAQREVGNFPLTTLYGDEPFTGTDGISPNANDPLAASKYSPVQLLTLVSVQTGLFSVQPTKALRPGRPRTAASSAT